MKNDWIGSSMGLCVDGVNSALRPDLIGPTQLAWMVNGTVRDGKPRTRNGLVQRLVLPEGKVQGAGYYSQSNGILVLAIGGKLYRVLLNGTTFSYEEITLSFYNSAVLESAWMVETPSGMVIQDGQSAAIIYNGSVARRADLELKEVPIGTAMAYGNGRLWVVLKNSRDLVAGDITTAAPGSELFFTETTYLLGGGAFYFPNGITGLAFLPVNNTVTGYGSLMVFGLREVISIRAEVTERDLWQVIPGFQTIVLDGIGTPSHFSITRVDQDLYWRDETGQIRSLRNAAQSAQGPGNTALSEEVRRITDFETASFLRMASGIYVNNRLFFTASPLISTEVPQNIVFNKIISLDCAPLASMRGKLPPAYDGEWTGVDIARMVQGSFHGIKRSFAIVRDDDGQNSLWEFSQAGREDSYLGENDVQTPVRIQSGVEFRRFDFGLPSSPKQLTRCDIYPAQIEGEVTMSLQWRVGNRNQWLPWGSFTVCAEMTDPPTVSGVNLLASPNEFDGSDWTRQAVTTPTATLLPETTANSSHFVAQNNLTLAAGNTYEATIVVEPYGATTKGVFRVSGLGGVLQITFNTAALTLVMFNSGGVTAAIGSIEAIPDGRFLIKIRGLFSTAGTYQYVLLYLNAAGSDVYAGNVNNGYNVYAASLHLYAAPHVWKNLRSQERGRVKSLTIPSQYEDTIQKLSQITGYSFQIRLVWEGNCTIDRVDVFARQIPDKTYSDVFNLSESCAQDTVTDNELEYTIIPAS